MILAMFKPIPTVEGGYHCAVIDPPWSFADKGSRAAPERAAGAGYSTYEVEEIADMPVPGALAADALVVLWAPDTHVPDALWLLAWWGLAYKHLLVWGKVRNRGSPVLRSIPEYPGYYADSNGEIWSTRTRGSATTVTRLHRIRFEEHESGYLRVHLCVNGVRTHEYVQRLILSAFKGPPPPGHEAAHLNGDRYDNSPSNLVWKTHAENELDKVEHGTWRPRSAGLVSYRAPQMGFGHYWRKAHEVALVATRGHPEIRSHSELSLILAPRGRHSQKPEELQDSVERIISGPYLELFARRRRPGWTTYGDELTEE